jgi:hypothetical protein
MTFPSVRAGGEKLPRNMEMDCRTARSKLGAFHDGELPLKEAQQLQAHLDDCPRCSAELASLRAIVAELADPGHPRVPDRLWLSIKRNLEPEHSFRPAAQPGSRVAADRPTRLRRLPAALAATVVLIIGLGLIATVLTGPRAEAATVDFSVLLDSLPLDPEKAFRKFLVRYDGCEASPIEARRHAPDLNFDVPEVLPGGFKLEKVYTLQFGESPGVAARYRRGEEFLGAIFHAPVREESYGTHRDYECIVGKHRGHKVEVGPWKLVHLTDPTTCHCVLSRLDEQEELPAIMNAVAPTLPAGDSHSHH